MKSIYKYPLQVDGEQILLIPAGAKILTVQMQGSTPCLWAEVKINDDANLRAGLEQRKIKMFGTGHDIPGYLKL